MHDSHRLEAERCVQHRFSKFIPLIFLVPPLCVLFFAQALEALPDRDESGRRIARVDFRPVELNAAGFSPLILAGAWTLTSDDSRIGGISALSTHGGDLLAVSDSGVLIRLQRPSGRPAPALVAELPAGPRSPSFKRNRDSEALVRDPLDRGWWVAFETHHELWLYDLSFDRALQRVELGLDRWRPNAGIEAMAIGHGDLLLFPERGREVLRIRGSQAGRRRLIGRTGRIADAATLPGGEVVLIERKMTWRGFANALVVLEPQGDTYRIARRLALPLGPLDNAEAVAVEAGFEGKLRLWLMTDDNHQRPMRTLLVALDVPPMALAGR